MNTSDGATAVITGGSVGIGADICQRLLDKGISVINISNEAASIDHPKLRTLNVDLTDREATRDAAMQIASANSVQYFVHCAGTVKPALMQDVDLNDLDYLTELHLGCAITLAQAFLPAMQASCAGRIVFLSSRGVLGLPTRTVYAATKAAMLGLVRTWALEMADQGITVNCIAPGPIETELFKQFVPDENRRAEIAQTVPVKRLGQASDIGRVAEFLLDEQSSFITGQTLYICGGASCGTLGM